MALGALSLSVTAGVQGRPFRAAVSGLTTGRVEVLGDGSPGFSYVNGFVSSTGLPYSVSTVALREYEPGVGQGYRDSRIDITAATRSQLAAQAIASLDAGRALVRWRVAGTVQPDGSISYTLVVEDDLGASRAYDAGQPPSPTALISAINLEGWSGEWATGAPPTFTPDTAPVKFAVTRAGFDATGNVTTYTDMRTYTRRKRQVYPNQALDTPTTVAVDDYVYGTDTISGVTNNSTEISPKPIAAWVMPSRLLVGNTVRWELTAFHRDARNGRYVTCVRVRAQSLDTSGNPTGTPTAWQTVSSTVISTLAEDAQPTEVYAGDLDVSGLADGFFRLEAEVYPWIGATASVLRSQDQTAAREFSPRYFTKNVALAAAPVLAYVSPTGSNATGAASSTAATARAAPFADVQSAITAAITANGGKADGIRIRIMSGTNVWGTFNSALNRRQDSAAIVIERDPLAATRAECILQQSAAVVLKLGYSGTNVSSLNSPLVEAAIVLRDLAYQRTATGQISNGGTGVTLDAQLWNVAWDNGGIAGTWIGGSGGIRFYGFSISNLGTFFTYGATVEQRLHRGVVSSGTGGTFETWVQIGCRLTGHGGGTFRDATKGMIVYNNSFPSPSATSAPLTIAAASAGDTISGIIVVQNVVERTDTTSATPGLRVSSDGANGSTYHSVIHYNVVTGYGILGRQNLFYDESSGTNRRTHRLQSMKGNIFVQINTKSDIFVATSQSNPTEAPFRTGNFAVLHGVGCEGNFSQFSASAPTSEAQLYPGLTCNIGASVTVRNDPLFVNYQGTTGAAGTPTAGAGSGDYRLQAGSPARGIVSTATLGFDFAGQPRGTGTQAAGAFR